MCKDPAMAGHRRSGTAVAVLALPDRWSLRAGLPHQLLGGAADARRPPLYGVRVGHRSTAARCAPPPASRCCPTRRLELLATADTVVVPGIHGGRGDADGTARRRGRRGAARRPAATPGWSRSAPARSCSPRPACSTAARPPRTGRTPSAFRGCFPQVRLDPDVLFVDDGDVLTSAGVAAGIDLCLHIVRRDHGTEVANRVARRCVVPPWRDGGQAQFIERPVPDRRRRGHRGRPAPGRWSTSTEPLDAGRRWPGTRG